MEGSEQILGVPLCLTCVTRSPPRQSKPTIFSIEHILQHAGPKPQPASPPQQSPPSAARQQLFDWLNCTRYRPPKLHSPKENG
ncbi:hypothetical protein J6590_001247 [Homalodisca vitripennis]|nr:hypothetical protein J6590_001247 [Homalodisca vitripennis]